MNLRHSDEPSPERVEGENLADLTVFVIVSALLYGVAFVAGLLYWKATYG